MAQQTAVEWLKMKLEDIHSQSKRVNPYNPEPISYNYIMFLIDYAKQMEKEQIENAHIEGQRVFDKHPHTQWTNDQAEQYYNEIYGKE